MRLGGQLLQLENVASQQHQSEDLLLDFEKRRQDIIAKKEEVQMLQARHVALTTQAAEAKRLVHAAGGAV